MKLYIVMGIFLLFFLVGCVQTETQNNDSIDVCTMEYAPVCGVDNQTYGNVCMAESQGIEIAYEGECGSQNQDMIACTREYMPVCGDNNETYSNACVAQSQGINIAYEGECESQTTTLSHTQGVLTYEFIVDKPTPCHDVNVTTMIQESFPPTVVISAQVQSPSADVICAQAISPQTINGTVEIDKPFYAQIVVNSQTITSDEFLEE